MCAMTLIAAVDFRGLGAKLLSYQGFDPRPVKVTHPSISQTNEHWLGGVALLGPGFAVPRPQRLLFAPPSDAAIAA